MNDGVLAKLIETEVINRGIKSYELNHEVFTNATEIEIKNNEILFVHYLNMIGVEGQIVKMKSASQYVLKNQSNMRVFYMEQNQPEPKFYLESRMVSVHQGLMIIDSKLTTNFFLLAVRMKVLDHEKSEKLHSA